MQKCGFNFCLEQIFTTVIVPGPCVTAHGVNVWQQPPAPGAANSEERALAGQGWGLREGRARFQGRKGKMLSSSERDPKYLEIMRQGKNVAPAEDCLMRDRLLYSLGKKLLSNSICLFYIFNEPDSVWSNYCLGRVWSEGQLCFWPLQ